MKKTLFLSILLTVLSFSFTSCEDEDFDPRFAPFVGSWVQDNGETTFVFYADGQGVYTDFNGSFDFNWEYDDYELEVYFLNGDEWDFEWDLDGEILELYDEDTMVTTYYQPF